MLPFVVSFANFPPSSFLRLLKCRKIFKSHFPTLNQKKTNKDIHCACLTCQTKFFTNRKTITMTSKLTEQLRWCNRFFFHYNFVYISFSPEKKELFDDDLCANVIRKEARSLNEIKNERPKYNIQLLSMHLHRFALHKFINIYVYEIKIFNSKWYNKKAVRPFFIFSFYIYCLLITTFVSLSLFSFVSIESVAMMIFGGVK